MICEQMEMIFPKPIDYIVDCEDYCTNDKCMECVLCDHYKGKYRAEVELQVAEYKKMLSIVFEGERKGE